MRAAYGKMIVVWWTFSAWVKRLELKNSPSPPNHPSDLKRPSLPFPSLPQNLKGGPLSFLSRVGKTYDQPKQVPKKLSSKFYPLYIFYPP